MTASEKIITFTSIEDILDEIRVDSQSKNILDRRYAVRFIMLDNFNDYRDLVTNLTALGIKSFDIESLLRNDKDRWITQDELKNEIKKIKESSIISPFSEIARFYDAQRFRAFLNEISLLENSHNNLDRRIYIPLIGLQNRFENFLNSFARIAESAPIWNLKSNNPQKVRFYLVNKDNIPESKQELMTLYDWLRFWKTRAPVDKIVCTSLPIITYAKNSQPDNIFTPVRIESAFDFIEKYYNLSLHIPYFETEERFWYELLSHIPINGFHFKRFVKTHFNVQRLTAKDILNKWTCKNSTEFDRWLLKHYYLKFISNNGYLNEIISNITDYSPLRLFKEVTLSIFNHSNRSRFAKERNELLGLLDERYHLPDSVQNELKEEIMDIAKSSTKEAISLCSGRFFFEKEMFVGWYKINKLDIDRLQSLYPEFAAYIKQAECECDEWINTYIQAYKQAKINDKYTDEIKEIVAKKNYNEQTFFEWYNKLELSQELLALESPEQIYWIDGLGIEYLSLIEDIINNSNFRIEQLKITKTNIPSSTEHNRFEDAKKISDLDDYIHSSLYSYPKAICEEIDIVKRIFKNVLNQVKETTIAIVSDHGLTALSRLVDSKKYATKASHEGRYIRLDSSNSLEDSDYVRCKNGDKNFKVALTHASLNKKPVREVHGGCTPEEVLVPFIIISNKQEAQKDVSKKTTLQKTSEKESPKQTVGFEEMDLF